MFKNKTYESKSIESIQDPNTGETIHRVSIPPELVEIIQKEMNQHQGKMQEFVGNSQNYFAILTRQLELMQNINKADNAVKNIMTDVIKKLKLDQRQPWQYNLLLRCFERRTPPAVPGMSKSEVEKLDSVGVKPIIQQGSNVAI